MMMPPKKCTVTKAFAALLLAGFCNLALAGQVAGTVINLSGALMAQKADGKIKVLAVRSEVEAGDTLVSEKNTYAQIKLIDNSEITLKPNTTFIVEAFAFDAGKPDGDSASFNLVKGGLRSITGLLGKRNKEKFQLKTPTATIGIRGTTFIAEYMAPPVASAQPGAAGGVATPAGAALAPGLYVHVIDGIINLSNKGGSQSFAAGQFGYTASLIQPPVIVPANPGLKFTPPPAFSAPPSGGNGSANKAGTVDCVVR
jgi:hypothetical protein